FALQDFGDVQVSDSDFELSVVCFGELDHFPHHFALVQDSVNVHFVHSCGVWVDRTFIHPSAFDQSRLEREAFKPLDQLRFENLVMCCCEFLPLLLALQRICVGGNLNLHRNLHRFCPFAPGGPRNPVRLICPDTSSIRPKRRNTTNKAEIISSFFCVGFH